MRPVTRSAGSSISNEMPWDLAAAHTSAGEQVGNLEFRK